MLARHIACTENTHDHSITVKLKGLTKVKKSVKVCATTYSPQFIHNAETPSICTIVSSMVNEVIATYYRILT